MVQQSEEKEAQVVSPYKEVQSEEAVSTKGVPYRIGFGGPDIKDAITDGAAPGLGVPDSDERPLPTPQGLVRTLAVDKRTKCFDVDWPITGKFPISFNLDRVPVSQEITDATGIKSYMLVNYRSIQIFYQYKLYFYGTKMGTYAFIDQEGPASTYGMRWTSPGPAFATLTFTIIYFHQHHHPTFTQYALRTTTSATTTTTPPPPLPPPPPTDIQSYNLNHNPQKLDIQIRAGHHNHQNRRRPQVRRRGGVNRACHGDLLVRELQLQQADDRSCQSAGRPIFERAWLDLL
ncbi:hypothetical protein FA15DRAFT_758627 [Coprinopsis marcescibilis]|uniref:Uncharacterized protein n=1 Tax=Coprinopsis marcescibilis TaxID=230819 RepID=A0A5C3KMQ6_COPMA|nr:hypothetical protein FA15DRAFT_758627 [Coprinopsis marcescibilis]